MNRIQSTERPAPFTANPGQPTRNVNFDIQEEAEGYSYYSVTVPIARWDYDSIVSAIITAEYPNDRMQAVINNFMQNLSSDSEQEFDDMQAWRNLAKKTVCDLFGETPSTTYAPSLAELVGQLKTLLRKEVQQLPDEEAMNVPSLFDEWKPGITVKAGERRYFAKELYKCVQGHTTQSDWTPDITPALWTKVSLDEWPQWVQPTGAHDAYNAGDKVTFEGQHYVSLINGNVWSPTAYPAGWQLEP